MNKSHDSEPDADLAALRALLGSGLIAGPDPSVLEDVMHAADPSAAPINDLALESQVEEIYREIIRRAPEHKVQPSTERVEACLDLLGRPQDTFRTIHITGTNGKTSTARMTEALLRERGLRTGRFTSPHLHSVRERIVLDGQAISPAEFVDTWEDVRRAIELVDERSVAEGGSRLSFFEVFTVMAYSAFAMRPIDVAVVEVGMGGRWDATNVLQADVAMLMPVALDHQQWLGSTVEEIAAEKLGILHPGKTLVCARQVPEVTEMAVARAKEQKAMLYLAGRDFSVEHREPAVGGQLLTVRTPAAVYRDIPLAMFGAYQAENAAAALMATEAFFGGGALSGDVAEHAWMATSSPGRMEIVKSSPLILVDAAHNPAGAKVSVDVLEESFPGPRVAVFSAMADKDIEGVLTVLEPAFAAVVVTQMDGERAADADDLAQTAAGIFGAERVFTEPDLGNAISRAADLAETADPQAVSPASVVVVGSIQLAGAARDLLGAYRPDSQ